MQYFGGKAKIAKEISKELQSRLKEGQAFVDLFCGSCNVVSKIKAPVRIANDLHKELISLHKAVQKDSFVIQWSTTNLLLNEGLVRKLTPTECERLQTVPDGYTSAVSDSQRYKMLGNGWTVDVIAHILQGLK